MTRVDAYRILQTAQTLARMVRDAELSFYGPSAVRMRDHIGGAVNELDEAMSCLYDGMSDADKEDLRNA